MEHIKIKIETIEKMRRKDGSFVEGMTKGGIIWALYKVNNQYSMFAYGDDKPNFEIGKEYEFDLETRQDGEYTNYTISVPKKSDTSTNDLAGLEKRVKALEDFLLN